MVKLNLELLDQDKIRSKKRRKLIVYALVPFIVLSVITFLFLRTGIYNIVFSTSVNSENYGLPAFATNLQKAGNLIEPYLPYYNDGFLRLIQAGTQDDLLAAETMFKESLKMNPPEKYLCAIYGNLSYSIELRGDLKYEEKDYNDSIVLYNQAETLLYENGCASKEDGSVGKDEKSQAAKERIEQKRREAVDANNNITDPSGDGDSEGNQGDGQELTNEQLQAIQNQQQSVYNQAASDPFQGHGLGSDSGTGGATINFDNPNF